MNDLKWRDLPALSTLRAFEATARLQGYSAAARSLNVTPAAIAQQVRKLEAEVGVALVQRAGRGLILTEAGLRLAHPLQDAFALIARGFEDLKLQQATRGIRVSATSGFVSTIALPALGDFWQRHPGMQVSFSPDENMNPIDLEAFDVVVRAGPIGHTWPEHNSVPLMKTAMIICAAPELVASKGRALSALPWLQDLSIGWTVFERMIRQAGCDPDRIEIVDPGSAKVEVEAALLGYGLFVTPEVMVRRQLLDGTLINLFTSPDIGGEYHAILPSPPLPQPLRLFVDWFVGLCADLSSSPKLSD